MLFSRVSLHKAVLLTVLVSPFVLSFSALGQVKELASAPAPVVVNWMTFEEAVERSKTEKRKFFVDVYTDWCGWCKVMDTKTFSEPHVAKMLNEKFYPVKFNAEQPQDVTFQGQTYRFVPQGRSGYHELAAMLLSSQMSYPTVVFLNEELTESFPLPGYRGPSEFYPYLVFFKDNYYKKGENAWDEFQKGYKAPF